MGLLVRDIATQFVLRLCDGVVNKRLADVGCSSIPSTVGADRDLVPASPPETPQIDAIGARALATQFVTRLCDIVMEERVASVECSSIPSTDRADSELMSASRSEITGIESIGARALATQFVTRVYDVVVNKQLASVEHSSIPSLPSTDPELVSSSPPEMPGIECVAATRSSDCVNAGHATPRWFGDLVRAFAAEVMLGTVERIASGIVSGAPTSAADRFTDRIHTLAPPVTAAGCQVPALAANDSVADESRTPLVGDLDKHQTPTATAALVEDPAVESGDADQVLALSTEPVDEQAPISTAVSQRAYETESIDKEKEPATSILSAHPKKRLISRRQLINSIARATSDEAFTMAAMRVADASMFSAATPRHLTQANELMEDTITGTQQAVKTEAIPKPDHSTEGPQCDAYVDTESLDSTGDTPPGTQDQSTAVPESSLASAGAPPLNQGSPDELHIALTSDSSAENTVHRSVCTQLAQSYVQHLLLEASSIVTTTLSPLHSKPPQIEAHWSEPESLGSGSLRHKSPNLQKRLLVKKDGTPPSPAIALQTEQQQPSVAPDGEEGSRLPLPPSKTAPTRLKTPRELARHKPRKLNTAERHDEASTAAVEESAKLSLKLPLSRDSFGPDGLIPSPMSSAREALEIYRPRHPAEVSGLKKPSSYRHPPRHPHHIQNSTIANATSYSRDSPRADAIAEAQKTTKSIPSPVVPTKSSTTVLLPLTTSVPPPTILATATTPSPTAKAARSIATRNPTSRKGVPYRQTPSLHATKDKSIKSPIRLRSGYCQQCVYEGRSCKINDCLKHQLIR